jgi:hypothetical protein
VQWSLQGRTEAPVLGESVPFRTPHLLPLSTINGIKILKEHNVTSRIRVLTSVSTKVSVFLLVAPCRPVWVYQRFRGLYCLHHQGDVYVLMAQYTRRYNPEDSHLQPNICLCNFLHMNLLPEKCSSMQRRNDHRSSRDFETHLGFSFFLSVSSNKCEGSTITAAYVFPKSFQFLIILSMPLNASNLWSC